MYLNNIEILTEQYDEIKNIIMENSEPENINEFENGCQISFESHSFVNGNNFLSVILLIKHNDKVNVSFICGGASKGRFIKFDWGTEKGSAQKIVEEIELWCQSNSVDYEILDDEYLN
jgi:hypothetical protein